MDQSKKAPNDIRIGFRTSVRSIIQYSERLLKEMNMRTLNFSAVGGSIGTLVNAVEVLKLMNQGLYQINRIATISYQSLEEGLGEGTQNQRLYPKLEVILTLDKPTTEGEGFQDMLSEAERKKLLDLHNKRRDERRDEREPQRSGRGFQRGGRPQYQQYRDDRQFRGGRPRGRGQSFRGRGNFRGRGQPFRGRGQPFRGRGQSFRERGYRNY